MLHKTVIALSLSAILLNGCTVTPKKMTTPEALTAINIDSSLFYRSQPPLECSLTLGQAIARALKYNLDHRVEVVQQALAGANYELAKMDMLPILSLSAQRTRRNNLNASSSTSILSNQQSLEPSTSQDRVRTTAGARLSWNALDFGLSYLQAKQEADRFLIADLSRKKAMIELMQQVNSVYWRAFAMHDIGAKVDELVARAGKSLQKLEQIKQEQLRSPLNTLQDLRGLIELTQQLETMRQTINQAQVELASLINERLTTKITFAEAGKLQPLPASNTIGDMNDLELIALINSSDYVSELYNARIDQIESRKALVGLLPSLDFSYGVNYDSNSYLVNNNWNEAGVQISWNILRLLAWDEIEQQKEVREQLNLMRRMATNMAVITKLHLARQDYHNSLSSFYQANKLSDVNQTIKELTGQSKRSQASTETQLIQSELSAIRAEMGKLLAYAQSQDAFGKLIFSTGVNPLPADYQQYSVAELGAHLDAVFARWQQGDLLAGDKDSYGYPQMQIPAFTPAQPDEITENDTTANAAD